MLQSSSEILAYSGLASLIFSLIIGLDWLAIFPRHGKATHISIGERGHVLYFLRLAGDDLSNALLREIRPKCRSSDLLVRGKSPIHLNGIRCQGTTPMESGRGAAWTLRVIAIMEPRWKIRGKINLNFQMTSWPKYQ